MNNTQKHVFRASYSYMKLWSEGNWQDAIQAYFKLERYTSRAMAEGKDLHEEWEQYIKANKRLPDVFGGAPLNNPIPEDKMEIPIYDWMTLVLKPDCIDTPDLHEFKSGTGSANDYLNSYQPAVYAIGLTFRKIYINKIHIHVYNQYSKQSEYSYRFVSKKLLKDGLNWIETIASEMHNYFVTNGLYEKFSAKSS